MRGEGKLLGNMNNKTAGLILPTVRVLLGIVVISVVLSFPSVNAESFTIRIPVSCTGSGCQAVLSDMEGKELEDMELKVGTESFFEISLEGPGKKQFLVKLKDKDTVSRIYDRTEYRVTVSSCNGEDGEILRTVTVQPLGTEEKSAVLRFRNKNLFHENGSRKIKDSDTSQFSGDTTVTAGESSPQAKTVQNSGNDEKSPVSDRTGGKLPQTGSRYLWLASWMAVAGGMMIAVGNRVKKNQKHGGS